jgi:hypothetical protein
MAPRGRVPVDLQKTKVISMKFAMRLASQKVWLMWAVSATLMYAQDALAVQSAASAPRGARINSSVVNAAGVPGDEDLGRQGNPKKLKSIKAGPAKPAVTKPATKTKVNGH